MSGEWKEYSLEDLLSYEQPTPYIVESTEYDDSFETPVLTAGASFILGYTDETEGVYNQVPVIIFDDFTTASKYVNFPFKVKSSAMKILTANKELVLPKFIYYRMQTIKFEHSTHKRYWIQQYSKIKVAVPSLSEQKRIVNKIEELFSELDSAVETLKKTKEQLAVYRNSIIDSSLPKCDLKTIKECLISMGQGWSPKCLNHNVMNDEEWAVIKTTSVQHGSFHYEENKALPQSLEPRPQHELVVGDLLITRAGPRVRCGVCCLVKETKKRLLNCDKVYRMKVDEKTIFPEYMELVLNSPNFVKQIDLCKTGGSESGLNLTQDRFLKIEIPVPSKNEQKNVIKEIAFKLSTCENIEKTVNDALIQAEAMRQSILKKAFEGSL